jgi:hypothetical protein
LAPPLRTKSRTYGDGISNNRLPKDEQRGLVVARQMARLSLCVRGDVVATQAEPRPRRAPSSRDPSRRKSASLKTASRGRPVLRAHVRTAVRVGVGLRRNLGFTPMALSLRLTYAVQARGPRALCGHLLAATAVSHSSSVLTAPMPKDQSIETPW